MTGHQNGEPGNNRCEERGNGEEKQGDIMRDRQQPFDQGHPPIEVILHIGVVDLQVDRLLFDGRRILVCEQDRVGGDPGPEAGQLTRKVEPPTDNAGER